jgi:SulP family sulfate permease
MARHAVSGVFPILDWLPTWRDGLAQNGVAALGVWAVIVPQSMAYASLAGVPPVNGLYASVVSLVIYALLGTSRQLNVGPSSGVAVLSAATIAPIALGDSEHYIALTATLAVVTGVVLLVAGVTRLGFVAEFLAKPVLAGYVIGLGLVITVGQIPALLGVSTDASGFVTKAADIIRALPDLDRETAALGVATLVFLLVLRRLSPRAPGALIAVVAGVLASRALGLETDGVDVLGTFDASVPDLGVPEFVGDDVQKLAAGALGIALLAYAESIAAARQFATTHGYEVDPNQELIAVGAANIGVGLTQGFPVDASMSRTAVADGAGQRTQLAGLLNAGLIVAAIVLLGSFFADLPKATLAAIVIAAVIPLMRTGELRRLRSIDDVDFALAAICLMGVLLLGVLNGIVVAVVASLVALVYRSFRPNTAVLGRHRAEEGDEDYGFRDVSRHTGLETYPGLLVFRFDQEIFFANAMLFRDALHHAIAIADPPVEAVLVDAGAVTHIDTTGLDMLAELVAELRGRGIRLMLARVKSPVMAILERSQMVDVIGSENFQISVRVGVDTYLRSRGESP